MMVLGLYSISCSRRVFRNQRGGESVREKSEKVLQERLPAVRPVIH